MEAYVKPVFHGACFGAVSAPTLYAPYPRRVRPKKMKHTVCLMSYLKIKTQSYVCTDVWQLVDASSNHLYLSDQQGQILLDYLL